MTADTQMIRASTPETPFIAKGKGAASQKTLPYRTDNPETTTEADQNVQLEGSDAPDHEADRDEAAGAGFTPTRCLFCNAASPDLGANLSHMGRSHSLLIPAAIDNGSLALAVDPETLLRYMHLVIHTYHECILCHTQRRGARAVQQHMVGKGHCRVDLEDGGSEFRDFYESAGGVEGDGEGGTSGSEDDACTEAPPTGDAPLRELGDRSLLLSSGKLLSHRSAPAPRHHRRALAGTQDSPTRRDLPAAASPRPAPPTTPATPPGDNSGPASDTAQDPRSADTGRALTRLERRAEANSRSVLSVALARMSLGDRAALAHLPAAEQRAVVLRQLKQQDRARHEARRFSSKQRVPSELCAASKTTKKRDVFL